MGRNQNMKLHCGCILGSRKIFVQFRLKGSFKLLENINVCIEISTDSKGYLGV